MKRRRQHVSQVLARRLASHGLRQNGSQAIELRGRKAAAKGARLAYAKNVVLFILDS